MMWLSTLLMLSQTFSQTPRVAGAGPVTRLLRGLGARQQAVDERNGPSTVVMISPIVMSFGSRASM